MNPIYDLLVQGNRGEVLVVEILLSSKADKIIGTLVISSWLQSNIPIDVHLHCVIMCLVWYKRINCSPLPIIVVIYPYRLFSVIFMVILYVLL